MIYVGCKIFHDLARKKVKDYVIKLENVQPNWKNSNQFPTEIELELELNLDIKTEVEERNRQMPSATAELHL